eukprot:TRINITY_DN20348_c0_g1_i1.p3 TRINITY_DN20348_c0_g1~~TRINITY_DN20348_c0_g1_i1.p3  ORF type:complete len:402 (+),score=116.33 TRINITY_DN20348_c0_g1_i1:78-1208(+)
MARKKAAEPEPASPAAGGAGQGASGTAGAPQLHKQAGRLQGEAIGDLRRVQPLYSRAKGAAGLVLQIAYWYLYYGMWGYEPRDLLIWARDQPYCDPRLLAAAVATFLTCMLNGVTFLFAWAIMHLDWPSIERYRILETPWPWNAGSRDSPELKEAYGALASRALRRWAGGLLTGLPVTLYLTYSIMGPGCVEKWIEHAPTGRENFCQLMASFILFDTWFYWSHRMLHRSRWYWTHRDHHEFKRTLGWTGQWGRPVDALCTSIGGFVAALVLLRLHAFTILHSIAPHVLQSTSDHLGYDFPFNPLCLIPGSGWSREHNFHHTHPDGNFALYFPWWDRICGTDRRWREYKRQWRHFRFPLGCPPVSYEGAYAPAETAD